MISSYPDTIYIHCFNLLPQFGPKRLLKLVNYFPTFEEAFNGIAADLLAAGIESEVVERWVNFKPTIAIDMEIAKLERDNIHILAFTNPDYPILLKELPTAPAILYYRGTPPARDEAAIAIVGTRKITTYGRSVTPTLVQPLAQNHITTVSGLAYGVDALVHKTTVDSNGRTIAIVACGIDTKTLYPQDHVLLAEQIIQNGGCIISEYAPGVPALKQNFVARNRIIAGLCMGTVIVECDVKSGALITARHALDQNRQVYAVPGPIYAPESRGPNNLIKLGAKLVTEAADILTDLNISTAEEPSAPLADTAEERVLLELLSREPMHANSLVEASGLTAQQVTTTLMFLEIKGRVRNLGAQQYIRSK